MIPTSLSPQKVPIPKSSAGQACDSSQPRRSPASSSLTPSPLSSPKAVQGASPLPRCDPARAGDPPGKSVDDRKASPRARGQYRPERASLAESFLADAARLIEGIGLPAEASARIAAELEECFDDESFLAAAASGKPQGIVDLARLPFHSYSKVGELLGSGVLNELIQEYSARLGGAACVVRWADVEDRQVFFPTNFPARGRRLPFAVSDGQVSRLEKRIADLLGQSPEGDPQGLPPEDCREVAAALVSGFQTVTTCDVRHERLALLDLKPLQDHVYAEYEDDSADELFANIEHCIPALLRNDDGPFFRGFTQVRLMFPLARPRSGD